MGGLLGTMWGWFYGEASTAVDLGPDADVPDSATGLTPRQKDKIRSTWGYVRKDHKKHGVEFFLLMFRTEPVLQTRFKDFSGKPLDELKNSKRLAAHGSTVMLSITGLVDNLDDPSCLIELLERNAINHKARGVKKSDFEMLAPVLMTYLRTNLRSVWDDVAEDGWSKTLSVINSVMFKAYDDQDEPQKSQS